MKEWLKTEKHQQQLHTGNNITNTDDSRAQQHKNENNPTAYHAKENNEDINTENDNNRKETKISSLLMT